MSAAKVALGRRLFFEPRLSVTGHYSCSSCHDPALSFSDGKARATGALGTPCHAVPWRWSTWLTTSVLAGHSRVVRSLEAQMRQPLFNTHPVELGLAGREECDGGGLAATDPGYATGIRRSLPC